MSAHKSNSEAVVSFTKLTIAVIGIQLLCAGIGVLSFVLVRSNHFAVAKLLLAIAITYQVIAVALVIIGATKEFKRKS